MADISKIKLPSGTTYDIKDAVARQQIAGGVSFLGVSTTAINDGGTEKPTINGTEVTPKNGDLVVYKQTSADLTSSEFIFTGTYGDGGKWAEFGDLSNLGALAYKSSASGTVAVPKTYTTTVTPSTTTKYVASSSTGGGSATKGTVTVSKASSGTATYTPQGTVSQPTFTGSSLTSTGSFTPAGSVSVSASGTSDKTATVSAASSGTATYTPAGTISVGTGTANYTPAGTVSTPTITVTPSTTTKYVASSASGGGSVTAGTAASCTLPSLTTSVSGETLTIGWSAGSFSANTPTAVTLPSFSSQTIATGISSASSTQPTFTGTGKELKFTGTGARLVTGVIKVPTTFTGSFTGTEGSISVSGTPSGTVSQPSFTGTGARLVTDSEVYTAVTMPSFSSQTIATGISSASTTTATTENKTVTVS